MQSSPFADCWFLTGPTAVGKSAVGLEVAGRLGCEIVALDSMTVYRGMNVGTDKPTAQALARVAHHLIDVLDPWEAATVDWYCKAARGVCNQILARGRRPLLVGGAPLYLKACLRGLFAGPAANPTLRAALEEQAGREGTPALHQRLLAIDPAAAAKIKPGDLRRIVRAIEVFETTGQPISELQQQFDRPADDAPPVACLLRPRDVLYDRINRRVVAMLQAGWIDETRRLLAQPRGLSRQAAQAVGYHEIAEHLVGRLGYDEMVNLIQTRTRQYCKHQLTWFRHIEELTSFEVNDVSDERSLIKRLVDFFASW